MHLAPRGTGIASAVLFVGLLLAASVPPAAALSCVQPPDSTWTTLHTIGEGAEALFLAHDPGRGSGCSTASDNQIGADWYVWKEHPGDGDPVVKVLDRGTHDVHTVSYPAYEGDLRLKSGAIDGDTMVHPVTDHRSGHLMHRFFIVDLENGIAKKIGLELPRDTDFAVTGSRVLYLTQDEGPRIHVFDAASNRHLVQDRRVQAHAGGTPDRLLAADDDHLVLVDRQDHPSMSGGPWLYDHDGRPLRALDAIDTHEGGIACARSDGAWLYYAYHEEPSMPWFPQPARYHLEDGTIEVLKETSHGDFQPCAPVHQGTMAVFSDERPDGSVTELIERDGIDGDPVVELPGLAWPLLVLGLVLLARRRR